MGFLSGKKKVNVEQSILEIQGTINKLRLRERRFTSQIEEQERAAREALENGERELARTYLEVAEDLTRRRAMMRQQIITLRTSLLNLEEAETQSEVLKAYQIANEALATARTLLTPDKIERQLIELSESFDQIAIASELLSENISGTLSPDAESAVDRRLEKMESEMLLEKEGVLPPIEVESETKPLQEKRDEKEKDIEKMIEELEKEAMEEREKETEG